MVLRQEHRAGEKVFVNYAGRTIPVQNPATGEIREGTPRKIQRQGKAWVRYGTECGFGRMNVVLTGEMEAGRRPSSTATIT